MRDCCGGAKEGDGGWGEEGEEGDEEDEREQLAKVERGGGVFCPIPGKGSIDRKYGVGGGGGETEVVCVGLSGETGSLEELGGEES